jgi:hypothetical protein
MAKRRDEEWRHQQYEARTEKLPASYLEAIDAPAPGPTRQQRLAPTISHAARAEA